MQCCKYGILPEYEEDTAEFQPRAALKLGYSLFASTKCEISHQGLIVPFTHPLRVLYTICVCALFRWSFGILLWEIASLGKQTFHELLPAGSQCQ